MYGGEEDIRALDLLEIEKELERLDLPTDLYQLWRRFLDSINA